MVWMVGSFSFPINLINILMVTCYTPQQTHTKFQLPYDRNQSLLSSCFCARGVPMQLDHVFLLAVVWSLLLPLFDRVLGCCNCSRFIKRSSLIAFRRCNKVVCCCWSGYLYKRSAIRVSSSLIWSSILGVIYGSVTARIFSFVFGVILSIKYQTSIYKYNS